MKHEIIEHEFTGISIEITGVSQERAGCPGKGTAFADCLGNW